MNYLLDILSPGSHQTENHATRSDLVNNIFIRLVDTQMIANICLLERMEAAISKFQPFKVSGQDELYLGLPQKGWNLLKGYYRVIFQACLRHIYVPMARKERSGIWTESIFLPEPGKESYFEAKSFRMIILASFQVKWLERLILYHINKDNNVQAKVSASKYGFRADLSTETALHSGLVRRVERCLIKKTRLWIFSGYCQCIWQRHFALDCCGSARAGHHRRIQKFFWGDDKIYHYKLWIISKFRMIMINVLDLAQTCWPVFDQAGSHKSTVGGHWGIVGAQPPEAIEGLGASLQQPEARGTGDGARSAQRFCFFAKIIWF